MRKTGEIDEQVYFDKATTTYYFRLKRNTPGVKIPRRMALIMRLALFAQQHREDSRIGTILDEVNCHKTVLYLLGLITKKQLVDTDASNSFAEEALQLSDRPFTACETFEEVYDLARSSCNDGEWCVGQIYNPGTGKIWHSFILGITEHDTANQPVSFHDRCVVFETQDIGEDPTHIVRLEDVVNLESQDTVARGWTHAEMNWRFIPLRELPVAS